MKKKIQLEPETIALWAEVFKAMNIAMAWLVVVAFICLAVYHSETQPLTTPSVSVDTTAP